MDDWQVGDLALCISGKRVPKGAREGFAPNGEKFLHQGGVYTVEAVVRPFQMLGLVLEGHHSVHPSRAYLASSFRRIKPLTDEERDSFLADLDTPVSPAVPSDGRKAVALHNAGDGHTSPAAPLSASLPEGARAPNREALSGSLFNPVHGGVV